MKKYIVIFLSIVLLLCLTACSSGSPENAESTKVSTAPSEPALLALEYESASFYFSEPPGVSSLVPNGLITEYTGGTYCFSKKIPEEDRSAVILETVGILDRIQDAFGIRPQQFTVCMREGADLPRVKDNTLYLGIDHFRTARFAVGIAHLVFGNEMPYGLVYALGIDIAEDIGYTVEESIADLAEALTLADTNPAYLDLNYACFLDDYTDAETLPKVKGIAFGFYDFLMESGRKNLYTDFSNDAYLTNLNDFLAANGKNPYDNSDLCGTIFYPGGVGIRLVWENSVGTFYMDDDYEVTYLGYREIDMFNSGYENLRTMVTDCIAQAVHMQEKLQNFNFDTAPVTTVFTHDQRDSFAAAVYLAQENRIHMYAADAFGHEYGHYLMRGKDIDNWLQELICHYYSNYPVDKATTPAWYFDMLNSTTMGPDDSRYEFEQSINVHLGHEMDWYSIEDYGYMVTAYTVMFRTEDQVTTWNSGIAPKLSFMHYLVELAGEQETLSAIIYNTPEKTFSKNWKELIADWKITLEDFSWALEYTYE